jgi:hypothetical protein
MSHVEDEQHSAPASNPRGAAGALDRAERGDRGGLKARPREDHDQIDQEEFDQLLAAYDNSFRNIAEGEVVKGTVLKVTPRKSSSTSATSRRASSPWRFLDETGAVTVEAGDIVDVLLEHRRSRRLSCCRAKKPRR